jgi:hypothetical protein
MTQFNIGDRVSVRSKYSGDHVGVGVVFYTAVNGFCVRYETYDGEPNDGFDLLRNVYAELVPAPVTTKTFEGFADIVKDDDGQIIGIKVGGMSVLRGPTNDIGYGDIVQVTIKVLRKSDNPTKKGE